MIEASIAFVPLLRKIEAFQKSGRVEGVSRTGFTLNNHFDKHFNNIMNHQRGRCLTESNRKFISTCIESLNQYKQYGRPLQKAKEDHQRIMQKFRKPCRCMCKDQPFSVNYIYIYIYIYIFFFFFLGRYHSLVSHSISISITISTRMTATKDFVASSNPIGSRCQKASKALLNVGNTDAFCGR